MTLFSKAVVHVVSQFSPPSGNQSGDLISVVRADESDKLVLMRLVIKTNHNGWFRNWTQYRPTDFTLSDIILQGKLPLKPDSTELQNLEKHLPPLRELPQSTRSDLFQRFCEVMKDRDALLGVEITLEEWCTGIAPVVTEQNASVSLSSSACAILDLLRPDPDSPMEWLGCPGTPGGPLTAAHLLVSAMQELPDEALSLVRECSPDVLKAFNALLIMLDLKNQKKSCSPLPLASLPLPLQDDKAFHWVQQLLITSNVDLRREAGGLLAERESDAGVLPLVLCVTVQGLCYLL